LNNLNYFFFDLEVFFYFFFRPLINFSASLIVLFKSSQYKFIDLLASSFPGIGKSIPVGSELVSKTAIIGMPNFLLLQLLMTQY
jgi:hypothetical protein